jgi:hypothetical protein
MIKFPKISKNKATAVYTILVKYGGASDHAHARDSFMYHLSDDRSTGCSEYRFQGSFGFGGKYWTRTNQVSYYSKDETPELESRCKIINQELEKVEDL